MMLRDDVVEAVRAGQFHIWTVESVDAVLQLLTGLPCGEPDAAGVYAEGSLHRLISDRLDELHPVSADDIRKPQESSKLTGFALWLPAQRSQAAGNSEGAHAAKLSRNLPTTGLAGTLAPPT